MKSRFNFTSKPDDEVYGRPGVTLRQQKGLFQDPEVGTEAHDEVCVWLAAPHVVEGIVENVLPDQHREIVNHTLEAQGAGLLGPFEQLYTVDLEHPVTVGANRFLYGFADALVRPHPCTKYESYALRVLIEVKTGRFSPGELLRQIKAYAHGMDRFRGSSALLYMVEQPQAVLDALAAQQIACVYLERLEPYEFKWTRTA